MKNMILSALALSAFLGAQAVKAPSKHMLIVHAHVLKELKEKFKRKLQESLQQAISCSPQKLTQTESYLSVYKDAVASAFGSIWGRESRLTTHKELISQIIAKEKELIDTHYVFYHAHNKEFIILHDFIKLLHSYMNLIGPRVDFTFLRDRNVHAVPYKNVNEFLDANPSIHDHNELTRSQMISVNLALFGNHHRGGESTFEYFVGNKSVSWSSLSTRLQPLFDHYNLNKKYLGEIIALTSHLVSPAGNLLQICVPGEMVDELVYLSKPFGVPYSEVILKNHYDDAKQRHTSIRPLLDYMRTNPQDISDLRDWQARLMFFDPMFDTNPAIKVFRYNTVPETEMAIYQQKLKEIVIQIVLEYLKTTGETHKEPIAKLYYYMMMHKEGVVTL